MKLLETKRSFEEVSIFNGNSNAKIRFRVYLSAFDNCARFEIAYQTKLFPMWKKQFVGQDFLHADELEFLWLLIFLFEKLCNVVEVFHVVHQSNLFNNLIRVIIRMMWSRDARRLIVCMTIVCRSFVGTDNCVVDNYVQNERVLYVSKYLCQKTRDNERNK